MAYRFTPADVAYLRSADGTAALATLADRPLTSPLTDVTAAKTVAGERFAAALETALLRRRAETKLARADAWLLDDAALQQATATPVAAHRADRLRGRDVHDVTCSVGADLVELAAVAGRCVGSDRDPVRLAMAQANCAARGVAPALLRADALTPVSRDTVVFADPARRDTDGRRHWRPDGLAPPLPELVAAYAGRDLVVKCAPGLDFAAVPWAAEVELVSLDGSVREACLWSSGLATPGITRRATVLRHNRPQWTITDADPDDCPVRPPGRWLVDPDGAVVRAGLVRHYAARHSLGQLDPHIAYLTGDTPPPGVRAFQVLDHGRYGVKPLRQTLRRHDAGALEILVRGLAVRPDELRRELRTTGSTPVTVVLTRIGDVPTAFVCHASVTVEE
ncbi:MAG TPA: class I SAM-dependent methyltransferase [Pseudonocardiaceae bacterium]|nr:class I SAM-dependent methyltransferase [Pseudonocardiaceae bacterium]